MVNYILTIGAETPYSFTLRFRQRTLSVKYVFITTGMRTVQIAQLAHLFLDNVSIPQVSRFSSLLL
jgi:hypothetical protein